MELPTLSRHATQATARGAGARPIAASLDSGAGDADAPLGRNWRCATAAARLCPPPVRQAGGRPSLPGCLACFLAAGVLPACPAVSSSPQRRRRTPRPPPAPQRTPPPAPQALKAQPAVRLSQN
uniref:Uncharacterized protein n=1 Tax=Oryza sativa subsp. japonica TaxID=39947 RepID=Q6ZD91_ORYSJ|nr:hypothetical protein [Oryza sativa Japonica Group]